MTFDVGAPAPLDARAWMPGEMHDFFVSVALPADLPAGSYQVRLALLQDASDLPAYALVFANDARVRDDLRRENVVATIAVTD